MIIQVKQRNYEFNLHEGYGDCIISLKYSLRYKQLPRNNKMLL